MIQIPCKMKEQDAPKRRVSGRESFRISSEDAAEGRDMLKTGQKKNAGKRYGHEKDIRKRGAMAAILFAAAAAVGIGNLDGEKEKAVWNLPTEILEQIPETVKTTLTTAETNAEEALENTRPLENAKEQEEPEGSFQVAYQGNVSEYPIQLAHCDCVYDAEGIQIYAYYLYWLMVPSSFPYNQYVLYIRTPQEELQIYPVKDYLVDEAHGILYTKIVGNDGFESVKRLSFTEKNGSVMMPEEEVFDAEAAEKMLCDAYDRTEEKEAAGGEVLFTNVQVELTEIAAGGTGILYGEAGGIERTTGKRYYVNWKADTESGTLTAEAYILKQYDPIKDKEELAACSEVFDEIEQGDWSHVRPDEKQYVWGAASEEWIRLDVNGDGMPELLDCWSYDLPGYENARKRAVFSIFAYRDGMAERVYLDECDGMEYFFVTDDGAFIYEWGVSGWPCTNIFQKSRFDPKWNVEYLDTIVRYRFEEYEEEEIAYFQEAFPDTYGVGGSGVYCLRERPKTEEELKRNQDGKYVVREYLTEEEFVKMYEDWTGWDFYKAQFMY